ncbi:M42 family peptidase, partial [Enterococcus faecalis]
AIKNLYLEKKNNLSQGPVVLFDSHSDEVCFMIQAIKENGLLRFLPLASSVPNTISAQKVLIRNPKPTYVSVVVSRRSS